MRHLAESGAIAQDASGRYSLTSDLDELALPQSIRDVIGQRVAAWGPTCIASSSTASVIGRTFDLEVLGAVAGTDPDHCSTSSRRRPRPTLLEESDRAGSYRFSHAPIQHALYGELSVARRQRTHLRVAEVLEASASGAPLDVAYLSELARHWQSAVKPTDAAKAITYTRQAAAAAMAALAPADAARLYSQALELLERDTTQDDRPVRVEVMSKLRPGAPGEQPHRGDRDVAPSRRPGAGDRRSRAARHLRPNPGTQPEHLTAGPPILLDVLRQALEAVGPDDHARRARLLAALVDETDLNRGRSAAHDADAAVAAADAAGDYVVTLEVTLATSYASSVEHVVRFAAQT